jgi:hypothetical protein
VIFGNFLTRNHLHAPFRTNTVRATAWHATALRCAKSIQDLIEKLLIMEAGSVNRNSIKYGKRTWSLHAK